MRYSILTALIVAGAFTGPNGAANVTADQADPAASFEQRVNDTLNLEASEIVTLDIDPTPGHRFPEIDASLGRHHTRCPAQSGRQTAGGLGRRRPGVDQLGRQRADQTDQAGERLRIERPPPAKFGHLDAGLSQHVGERPTS